MKRLTALAKRLVVLACMGTMLVVLGGCSQESYTPPEKTPTLASPTIGKDGTLRVGVNTQNPPLAGQSTSSSNTVGIDVDVAAALADQFGLKLEIVDVGSDPEAALQDNRVDIVMGVDQADTTVSFWRSTAYLPTGVALFAQQGTTTVPTNAMQPSIAAQVSSKSAWAVTNEFTQGNITTTTDLRSAFSSLESGTVQYVAADAIIGTYAAHTSDDNVQIVALMEQPGGYCVGVLESNSALRQSVSNALNTLVSTGVVSIIETKWLGTALELEDMPLTAGASSSSSSSSNSSSSNSSDSSASGSTDSNSNSQSTTQEESSQS